MSRSSITFSIATWMRSARSGSSLIATIPLCERGISPKWIVSGSPEVATLGHLHRVDVADQVGDRGVRRGELLGVPLVAVPPRDREVVAQLGGPPLRLGGDRVVRVLTEVRPGDDRGPLVEQTDQRAQQSRLALPALAEEYDVVAGQDRPLQLRDHRGREAVQARPRVDAGRQRGQEVVAQLGAEVLLLVSARAELTEGGDRGRSHVRNASPRANSTTRSDSSPERPAALPACPGRGPR